ncbi:MAG: VWA domain-containing protein [Candidatus Aminicenantes bacterium]|nr:VWA domain-containing protein [Candidatus Aminicenantes bacterium]
MKKYVHFILILFLAFFLWAGISKFSPFLFSQTEIKPLRYEVEVVLIEIPLYVVDKKGNPVKNLKPEDLTLYENGKEQKITHFVLVQNDSPQIASLVSEYPAARRQFLLFFDFAFANPAKILKAREASLNFIKEKIFPNDLIAVATYSGIGGLKVLSNFTNDREQLYHIINTLGLAESKQRMLGPVGFSFPTFTQEATDTMLKTGSGSALGDDDFMELLDKVQKRKEQIYGAYVSDFISELNKLSLALNTVRGRKHIIFFSEGFDSKVLTGKSLAGLAADAEQFAQSGGVPTSDTDSRFGDTGLRMRLYDALKLIASADCPVHSVDIGGLRTQAGSVTEVEGAGRTLTSIRRGQDTLTVLSRETGGLVYQNVNEVTQTLENLLEVTNTYYILGYYPEDKKKEGKFRKIKIKTDRSDIKISYRKGYYEAKPYKDYSNLEKRIQLVEYIVKDLQSREIQFESLVSAFRGREGICQVPVFLKFPGRQFLERKKSVKLEIYGYAISSSGAFKDFFHQTITLSPQKVRKKLELYGVKYFDLHLLPPGDYKIKMIVRDKETGEIGSQIREISVPHYDKGELGLSGPVFIPPAGDWVLSRGYDPQNPTGRKKGFELPLDYPYIMDNKPFVPGVIPTLSGASPAQFFLRVYNLRLHPQTKVPQTEMSFEIVDLEGKSTPFKNVGLLRNPNQVEAGVFDLFFQANFKDLPWGSYQLRLTFKDSISNQKVVSETPFVLE